MIKWENFSDFITTGIPAEILYPSLALTMLAILVGVFSTHIKKKRAFIIWALLLEYLFIVICSTVICRKEYYFVFDRLELVPFWTYRAVINHVPGVSVWDIVLNVVLFIPLGFLLKLLYPSATILKVLLLALSCSLFIEFNQFFFEKGAAQIDDVIHNTVGAAIGWSFAKIAMAVSQRIMRNNR